MPFPPSATDRIQVSVNGGTTPRWRSDGNELFFLAAQSAEMWSAEVQYSGSSINASVPKRLHAIPNASSADLTADGKRWILSMYPTAAAGATNASPETANVEPPYVAVFNWIAALQHK